jgi:hypothetical protein
MQFPIKTQNVLPKARALETQSHAHIPRPGKAGMGWCRIQCRLHTFFRRSLYAWYIWRGAFRSFRGHIQIQSTKWPPSVGLGQSLLITPAGSYQENIRVTACNMGIDKAMAIYPWADIVDLRMFLMGFDAGEEFGLRTDSEMQKYVGLS